MKKLVKKKSQRKKRLAKLIAGSVIAGAMLVPANVEAVEYSPSGKRAKKHARQTKKRAAKKKKVSKKKAPARKKKAVSKKARKKASGSTGVINEMLQRLFGQNEDSLASMDTDTQVELIAAHHRDESQELLDEAASLDAIAQQNEIAANNSALSEQTRTDHAKQATLAREAARKLRARSARADEIANQWARVTAR